MKTTLSHFILITASIVSTSINSQTILNPSFETWNATQYQEPNSWSTSNTESLRRAGAITTTSVTGFSGNAARMETKVVGVDTVMGYIFYGANIGDPISGKGGLPYSQKPTAIAGYYRYNLPVNDTALIFVSFKKNGVVLNRDWIKIRGTGSQATFTTFSYTLTAPSLTVTPDSVMIAFASSNALNNVGIQNNSFLEVDQISFTGAGITQTITNGSFDTWGSFSVEKLASWGVAGEGVSKVTPGFSGSYAIELNTFLYPSNFIGQSGITNGYFTQNGPPKGGRPYIHTLDTLYGYYKFSGSNDSGVVSINLTKLHSQVGGAMKFLKSQNTWTLFKVPISSNTAPDSMRLEIYSSMPGSSTLTAVGSKLQIDNLTLYSQVILSIHQADLVNNALIYPNPANDLLNIVLGMEKDYKVSMFDFTGKKINADNISSTPEKVMFDMKDLAKGIYFIRIENNEASYTYKVIKD